MTIPARDKFKKHQSAKRIAKAMLHARGIKSADMSYLAHAHGRVVFQSSTLGGYVDTFHHVLTIESPDV